MSSFAKNALCLAHISTGHYRGSNLYHPSTARAVFGGQLMVQALAAAYESVSSLYQAHSLHSYFIRPVRHDQPVDYLVTWSRDGATFSRRLVEGSQGGATALQVMMSFTKTESSPICLQEDMPHVSPPDKLKSYTQLINEYVNRNSGMPEQKYKKIALLLTELASMPIVFHPLDPSAYMYIRGFRDFTMTPQQPTERKWIKIRNKDEPGRHGIHQLVAVYMSDYEACFCAHLPHPDLVPRMEASLDHTIWFHTANYDYTDWVLVETSSHVHRNARFVTTGRMWCKDGQLIASFTQETILRGELLHNKL